MSIRWTCGSRSSEAGGTWAWAEDELSPRARATPQHKKPVFIASPLLSASEGVRPAVDGADARRCLADHPPTETMHRNHCIRREPGVKSVRIHVFAIPRAIRFSDSPLSARQSARHLPNLISHAAGSGSAAA